tara:strand:+ start:2288 stop:2626 length:339 start_codon:yes stop_codon:yes gene_type:complete
MTMKIIHCFEASGTNYGKDFETREALTGRVGAAIRPQVVDVRLPSGEWSYHCPAIVEARVSVSDNGDEATVWIVRQDGTLFRLMVNASDDRMEKEDGVVAIDQKRFRYRKQP